jgi:hypothetical protein
MFAVSGSRAEKRRGDENESIRSEEKRDHLNFDNSSIGVISLSVKTVKSLTSPHPELIRLGCSEVREMASMMMMQEKRSMADESHHDIWHCPVRR